MLGMVLGLEIGAEMRLEPEIGVEMSHMDWCTGACHSVFPVTRCRGRKLV